MGVSPIDCPLTMSRIWCAFEVLCATRFRADIRAAPVMSGGAARRQSSRRSICMTAPRRDTDTLKTLAKTVSIKLDECKCYDKEDRNLIMEYLAKHGPEESMNALVT